MQAIFEAVAKISTGLRLAAFAIAVLAYLAARKTTGMLKIIVGAIVVLALVAILGSFYVESHDKVYSVRAVVLSPEKTPVDYAKVWSSQGGEPKKVEGGWQFDIPSSSISKDQKLTIYATVDAAFLRGQGDIVLASDFHPNLTIVLQRPEVKIRGIVTDENGRAIEGASVIVVGYADEMMKTKADGGFQLPAHAADGQQVRLHAEKSGLKPEEEWVPAGTPVDIVLRRR
jgi:hypothetical protein